MFKLVAVIDGVGESATVNLYVENGGEVYCELPWPHNWPERVESSFLKKQGFHVVLA